MKKRGIDKISQDELDIFKNDVMDNNPVDKTKRKLVKDKSNGYDLGNKLAFVCIENKDIEGFKNVIKGKNFNPEYLNKDGKSIKSLTEEWALSQYLESLLDDSDSQNMKNDSKNVVKELNDIVTNFEIIGLDNAVQTINITGEGVTFNN